MADREPPSLSILVDRIRLSGVIVGLGFVFSTMTIAVILQWSLVTPLDILIVLVPAGVAIAAMVFVSGVARGVIVTLAALAAIAGILVVPTSAGFLWPPIASVSLGFGVVAASSLPIPWATAGIVIAAITTRIGVTAEPPPTLLISTSLMDEWVTPLSVLSLSAAFLIVLNAWARAASKADESAHEVRSQLRDALLAERVDEAHRAVDRRLHETLLNTLAALAAPVRDVSVLRQQCAQDLESASRIDSESWTTIDDVIMEAIQRVPRVKADVVGHHALPLPDSRTGRVLRDALIELLRNVDRHAGTSHAEIHCDASPETVVIRVEDDGVGVGDVTKRFGLRSAVQDPIRSVGGTVALEPREPRGTRATITLPRARYSRGLQPPTALAVLLGSPAARIALGPTLVLGIVAVPFALVGFTWTPAILIGFLVTLVAALALAVFWDRAPRRSLAGVVLAASFVTMGIAAVGQGGCQTATGMHWIIYAEAGAVVLAILSFQSMTTRVLLVVATLVVSIAASMPTPPECRLESLDAAVENIVWVAAAIGVVSLLARVVDARRAHEYWLWLELQQSEANLLAAEGAQSRWRSVSDATWNLLTGIAQGGLDPDAPSVRHLAAVEEARLRTLLECARLPSERLRYECEGLAQLAASHGVPLRIIVIEEDPGASIGEVGLARIGALIRSASGHPVQVSLLPDVVLCTVPAFVPVTDPGVVIVDGDEGVRVVHVATRETESIPGGF